MATYPDTNFPDSVDELGGGENPGVFGGKAWLWAQNAIKAAQLALYNHLLPYRMQRPKVSDAVVAGDLVVEDITSQLQSDYTLRKVQNVTYNEDTTPRYGMAAEPIAAGARGYVIMDGVGIPPSIHGLAAPGPSAAGYVAMSLTTSRIFLATGDPSEIVIGTINAQGYVRLFTRTILPEPTP